MQAVETRIKKLRSKISAHEKAAGGIREDVEVSVGKLPQSLPVSPAMDFPRNLMDNGP